MTERSLSLDYLTALPGVGSSPALLAGVPCGFSRGSFVFAHLLIARLIGPSHMRGNNLESYVKLNLKKKSVPYYSKMINGILRSSSAPNLLQGEWNEYYVKILCVCMRGSRNFHERGSNENGNFWSQTRGGVQPKKFPKLPFFR